MEILGTCTICFKERGATHIKNFWVEAGGVILPEEIKKALMDYGIARNLFPPDDGRPWVYKEWLTIWCFATKRFLNTRPLTPS